MLSSNCNEITQEKQVYVKKTAKRRTMKYKRPVQSLGSLKDWRSEQDRTFAQGTSLLLENKPELAFYKKPDTCLKNKLETCFYKKPDCRLKNKPETCFIGAKLLLGKQSRQLLLQA